jgi:exonuclease SbcC
VIEKLVLKNFQRHESLTIEFDPQITTLIGPSDAGKSAIIRALLWLATNRPAGDSFVRHGSELASVSLWVDGHKITRQRGKGVNRYSIDGKELAAFGQGVPEEISRLLNIDEINISRQHQPHYLFADSPGEVARQLNAVINLGAIDATLAKLGAELRQAKAVVGVSEQRLATARADRDRLAWVGEAEQSLLLLEQKIEAGQEIRQRASRLASLLDTSKSAQQAKDRLAEAVPAAQTAAKAATTAFACRTRVERLRGFVERLERGEQERYRVQKELKAAEASLAEAQQARCPLCGRE